jgi:hypothetical protein
MIHPNEEGLILCPCCSKMYKPKLKRKTNELIHIEFPNATKEEREQLISGICPMNVGINFLE